MAIIMIVTLIARYQTLIGTFQGFCELAMMSVLLSLCFTSILESAARGFKVGFAVFLIGIGANIIHFLGFI